MKNYCTYWVKNTIGCPEYIGRSQIKYIKQGYPLNSLYMYGKMCQYESHANEWCKKHGIPYNHKDHTVYVINTFDTLDEVQADERRLHIENDVVNSPMFFNKIIGDLETPAKPQPQNTRNYYTQPPPPPKLSQQYIDKKIFKKPYVKNYTEWKLHYIGDFITDDKYQKNPEQIIQNHADLISTEYIYNLSLYCKITKGWRLYDAQKAIREKTVYNDFFITRANKKQIVFENIKYWEIHHPCGKVDITLDAPQYCRDNGWIYGEVITYITAQVPFNGCMIKYHVTPEYKKTAESEL